MNMLEQSFMQQVPSLLHDISDSLKTIAGSKQAGEPAEIWVLFGESLYDYELMGRNIHVFTDEDDARKEFGSYVEEARKVATDNGWEIGSDDGDFFEAYPAGSWGTSHETVELSRTVLNGKVFCHQ